MSKSALEEVRDLAYTAVGFGILGFQRTMVMRTDLKKAATKRLGDLANISRHLAK